MIKILKKIKIIKPSFIIILVIFFTAGFLLGEDTGKKNFLENNILLESDFNNQELTQNDFNEVINLWQKIDEKFIDTRIDQSEIITKQDHIWGIMKGLTASFQDPYTIFLPPETNKYFQDDIKGEFSGVGMEIINRNGFLTVVSPLPDTPAFQSGIKAKDIILEIDGKDSLRMSSRVAVKLIRGEKGTAVLLKVLRKGEEEPLEIKIIRDIIEIPVIKTFEQDGVFVIKIYNFTENSPQKFLEGIQEFIKSKNQRLIIDVRGNPGGHLFAVVYILGMFLEKDTIILTEHYAGKKEDKILKSGDHHSNDKLINIFNDNLILGILVDGGSASASEILAGVLLDHQQAIIFGENTFGKGTVQELVPLKQGAALKVTTAKWILPKGSWISSEGISPDIEISISTEEIEKKVEQGTFQKNIDSQLYQTIQHLSQFKNVNEYRAALDYFSKIRLENEIEKRARKIQEIQEKF